MSAAFLFFTPFEKASIFTNQVWELPEIGNLGKINHNHDPKETQKMYLTWKYIHLPTKMLEFFFLISVRRGASPQLWAFESWSSTPAAIHQPCHGMEGGTTIMEQICNSYIRYVRYVNWTGEWKFLPFYGKQNCVLFQFGLMKLICKVVATEFPKLDPAIRYYLQPNLRQFRLLESYRKLEEHQLGTWQMEIQHDDDDQSRNRINPTKFNRNLQCISSRSRLYAVVS